MRTSEGLQTKGELQVEVQKISYLLESFRGSPIYRKASEGQRVYRRSSKGLTSEKFTFQ